MESIEVNGVAYVSNLDTHGDCGGGKCVAFNSETLCQQLPCVSMSPDKQVFWIGKDQVELNTFFGRPITEQIEMFPETLAVTREEEEDWQTMQKKVATGVTDGTQYHRQVGGDHYFNPIQPWDIIRAWELNYWEGNIVKYVLRHKGKNKVEDLEKARHYLDYLIENYDELYPVSN